VLLRSHLIASGHLGVSNHYPVVVSNLDGSDALDPASFTFTTADLCDTALLQERSRAAVLHESPCPLAVALGSFESSKAS
jgi:hypothetical protein